MNQPDGGDKALSAYLDFSRVRPEAFRNSDSNGIVILLDPAERLAAEREISDRLASRGLPREWCHAGLFYEDQWLVLVRDVVRFPDGSPHTYHRIVLKGGEGGVAIVPIVGGRVLLIRHFRHGVRDWSWELPRGGPEKGLSAQQTVALELREELDAVAGEPRYLGRYHTNTGMMTAAMHVYAVEVLSYGKPNLSEGIEAVRLVTAPELEAMIVSGQITDSNTIAGFTLARAQGLFDSLSGE